MSAFSDLSKKVGLDSKKVSYPKDQNEVETACDYDIMNWNRHLPSPTNDKEVCLSNLIYHRFIEMRNRLQN